MTDIITEEEHWPKRLVQRIEMFDGAVGDTDESAARFILECGHEIVVTGAAINRSFVHCKMCHNEVKN
jgi:hypothetical protein